MRIAFALSRWFKGLTAFAGVIIIGFGDVIVGALSMFMAGANRTRGDGFVPGNSNDWVIMILMLAASAMTSMIQIMIWRKIGLAARIRRVQAAESFGQKLELVGKSFGGNALLWLVGIGVCIIDTLVDVAIFPTIMMNNMNLLEVYKTPRDLLIITNDSLPMLIRVIMVGFGIVFLCGEGLLEWAETKGQEDYLNELLAEAEENAQKGATPAHR